MNIVKLGGSVITDKRELYSLRQDNIGRLSREVSEGVGSEAQAVLVHGAGSFGHILAKRYSLKDGYMGREQYKWVARVQRDVRTLNNIVVESLEVAGVPATGIPPGVTLRMSKHVISDFESTVYRDYLALGILPVTFGDVVIDTDGTLRFGIVSGDDLMLELARCFQPKRAIFVADVDGVYTEEPAGDGTPRGELLRRITCEQDVPFMKDGSAGAADVTGGMAGKVRKALEIAEVLGPDGEVLIVNGNIEGRSRDAMLGKDVISTMFKVDI